MARSYSVAWDVRSRCLSLLAAAVCCALLYSPACALECVGDCDANAEVSVAELTRCVNLGLGTASTDDCRPCDASGDGEVTVDEVIRAVDSALLGCVFFGATSLFSTQQRYAAGSYDFGGEPFSVAVADLDADGVPDLVTANREGFSYAGINFGGTGAVLLGMDGGAFSTEQRYGEGRRAVEVAVADLNWDDVPDLVVASVFADQRGGVWLFFGAGDGTFSAPTFVDAGAAGNVFSVAVADLDGDDVPDLVTANGDSNDVSVLLGVADGIFLTARRYPAGVYPISVAIADLNADGVPDLVTANAHSDDISVLLGAGGGTFTPGRTYSAGDAPRSVAVADLDADGVPDLVAANEDSDDISVLLGAGSGTFAAQQLYRAGARPFSVAAADLNADHVPDLVTANADSDDVSVLLGAGDGTFLKHQRYRAGNAPRSVAVADLNADDVPDLVIANGDSNDVSVLIARFPITPEGRIRLDRNVYSCADVVRLIATDEDLAGTGSTDVTVTASGGDIETVTLTEASARLGSFGGSIPTASGAPSLEDGTLQVADGERITGTYEDADDGSGSLATGQDTATLDCLAPIASSVTVTDLTSSSATVTVDTNEPTNAVVRFGTSCGSLTQSWEDVSGHDTSHTIALRGLAGATRYFFIVEVTDRLGNVATRDNGGACFSFVTPDFFTEVFAPGDYDLSHQTLTFTPDGSADFYAACRTTATDFPTVPAGGNLVDLAANSFAEVTLSGGAEVALYGTTYRSFFIGSNGYITFTAGDTDSTESLAAHFNTPRISGLFHSLNPAGGGAVSWKQLANRVAVTFEDVPQDGVDSSSFQIELFFDGTIRITHLAISAAGGLVGLSEGLGVPAGFVGTDLSAFGGCSRGVITLRRGAYQCVDVAEIRLADGDLAGLGPVDVTLTASGGDSETVTLGTLPAGFLVGTDSVEGAFVGAIDVVTGPVSIEDGFVQVADGEVLTATYEDADDGTGNPATVQDTAMADCLSPVTANVMATDVLLSTATVTLETNEPAHAVVRFGTSCDRLTDQQAGLALDTFHEFGLTGLAEATQYFFVVDVTDAAGKPATDDNEGACYSFTMLAFGPPVTFELGSSSQISNTFPVLGLDLDLPWSATLDVRVSTADANGVRTLLIPSDAALFEPTQVGASVGGYRIEFVCTEIVADAFGFIDCDGGSVGLDLTVQQDHNTTPGSPGNGGGLPDDPSCKASSTFGAQPSRARLESGQHAGACNSPLVITDAGMFGPGDAQLPMTTHHSLLRRSDSGADGVPCTADDTPLLELEYQLYLTTGSAKAELFDADNRAAQDFTKLEVGSPFDCPVLDDGGRLVGGSVLLHLGGVSDQVGTVVFDLTPP